MSKKLTCNEALKMLIDLDEYISGAFDYYFEEERRKIESCREVRGERPPVYGAVIRIDIGLQLAIEWMLANTYHLKLYDKETAEIENQNRGNP